MAARKKTALKLGARLTSDAIVASHTAIAALLQTTPAATCDASGVEACDTSGIQLLCAAVRAASVAGGSFTLTAASEAVRSAAQRIGVSDAELGLPRDGTSS